MISKHYLRGVLLLPILGISLLMARSEYNVHYGKSFEVPISGYDPRDLLHGHYLTYRFNWNFDRDKTQSFSNKIGVVGIADLFDNQSNTDKHELCVIGEEKKYSYYPIFPDNSEENCLYRIKGTFINNRDGFEFLIGAEKFYIPENHSTALEDLIRTSKATIKFRLHNNKAAIEDLFLDGKPWREMLKK